MPLEITPKSGDKLNIQSGQGAYDVHFFHKVTEATHTLNQLSASGFVIDRKVFGLYEDQLKSWVGTKPYLLVDATEDEKTLRGVEKVTTWMQKSNFTKQSTVCAIGGGIIQDIVTVSAQLYYRGIRWCLVPTTLLSMADSCIGAKGGVNLNEFKNQLGGFYSPSVVTICLEFTNTLTDSDLKSGYGEILKLALTSEGWSAFEDLERLTEAKGLRGDHVLDTIRKSLQIKKTIIEEDEYEKNLRRILNYGHSFGHSLESATAHEIPHGLAVAWGLDLINFIGWKRQILSEPNFKRVHRFIQRHLAFKLTKWPPADVVFNGAKRDKKIADGKLGLIFRVNEGRLSIVQSTLDADLSNLIGEYFKTENVYASH